MIEFELPCCGSPARLVDLSGEVRCEACGIVAELAPDALEAIPAAVRVAAVAIPASPALAA